jgi:NADPH-dependent 2,4-dienoyl-CoA reductase/sulfur reductase-like enzyme/nitrite reductase/ring-hydroxylating ferredoxin subunit
MQNGEYEAGSSAELSDGQMKQIETDGEPVLVARIDGKVHAVGGRCPHYGGPLAEGVLCGHHVRCPWHQACFDVTTGQHLEPPALESLPRYEAREESGKIFVRLRPPSAPRTFHIKNAGKHFAILGAGAAGLAAAQRLREAGFDGRISLISHEETLPYDRPALSKNFLAGQPLDHPLDLKPMEFYERFAIDRRTERVEKIADLRCDKLLLAVGSVARKLNVPGENLRGVHVLRSLADAEAISNAAKHAKRAVLIGSGFIGMEAAASLRQRKLEVTIIMREKIPLAGKFGDPIGTMFQKLHENNGVVFHCGVEVDRLEGEQSVKQVVLKNGDRVEADLVMVAVGAKPGTDFLESQVPVNDDGSVTVNQHFQVRDRPNLYAAGDIARFPSPTSGELIRIEHWRTALQHGRTAALNMAGHPTLQRDPPYFWTFQFDTGLDYVGHADKWDELVMDGDSARHDFLCYYVRNGFVDAVAGCNRSQQTDAIAEVMRSGRRIKGEEVRGGSVDWMKQLPKG